MAAPEPEKEGAGECHDPPGHFCRAPFVEHRSCVCPRLNQPCVRPQLS